MKIKLSELDETKMFSGCPFNIWSDEANYIQNMGCLPDSRYVLDSYENNKGHWKCHSGPNRCGGLKEALKKLNHPMDKNNNLFLNGDNEYTL